MKQVPLIILFLLFCSSVFAQPGAMHTVLINKEFEKGNHTPEQFDSAYFGLPNPIHSKYKSYIRITVPRGTIDLYSQDNKHFNGTLLNSIIQDREKKDRDTKLIEYNGYKYFYQITMLDSAACTKVATQLLASGQDTLPDSDSIKSWHRGWFDCNSYIYFQFYRQGKYININYNCISGQDSTVQYYNIINSNKTLIYKQFKLYDNYNSFTSKLPQGCTYADNGIQLYTLTPSEQRRYYRKVTKHKADWQYLDSLSTKLNDYIGTELTEILNADSALSNAYLDYHIELSRKNKLLRIKNQNKIYDFSDFKESIRNKRAIRRAFKKVHIPFVKSKVKYWKNLYYSDKKAFATDYNYYGDLPKRH